MEMLTTLTTNRTHLFPGARLELDGRMGGEVREVVVLFSDGSAVEAVLDPAGREFSLRVDEYRTAAGASIPAKAWDLEREAGGTLRVVGPASD